MSTIPPESTPESSRTHHHHQTHRQDQSIDHHHDHQPQPPDNDRTTVELRAADCNLASLCDHIQMEGFNSGSFSDVVVQAMGSTYRLHRLILSRSSYFRNMLHGPWKESGAPTVALHIDDANVNSESIAMALGYLYGHHPKLNDNNAFRVLAAASFLDLHVAFPCYLTTSGPTIPVFLVYDCWITCRIYALFAQISSFLSYGPLTS